MSGISYAALLAVLGMLGGPPQATAQSALPTLSLEETRLCLLDERDLDREKGDLEIRRSALLREEQDLSDLKRRVEEAQTRVFVGTVADPVARTEYESLRDRQYVEFERHSARQRDYNEDVRRYNERLVAFNGRCGGNRYSDYNLREARRQLGW